MKTNETYVHDLQFRGEQQKSYNKDNGFNIIAKN